jgi:hypothetical protein
LIQDMSITLMSGDLVKVFHVGGGMPFTVTLTFSNCMLKV